MATDSGSIHAGYVRSSEGDWYVQLPADNRWGFVLCDDELSHDFPPCNEWEPVAEADVPDGVRESLGWIIEDYRDGR
mgnify:CR=1 FL=1